jgi:hypothetical protein
VGSYWNFLLGWLLDGEEAEADSTQQKNGYHCEGCGKDCFVFLCARNPSLP